MVTVAPTSPVPGPAHGETPGGEPEPRVPIPIRFWWLKRLTLLGILVALGLAGLRVWWGWEADRRLRRWVDPLVAAGWPVKGADMNPVPVPDGENAAAYLKAATDAVDKANDSPAASSLSYPSYPPYGSAWETLAEKSVTGSAKAFPLIRRARAHERFDWGTRIKRPVVATLLPHLNSARHLANTVGDAALYAHLNGDDAAALEAIRDVRHLSRAAGDEPFLVSHLVSIGIEALAQSRLQVIATGLRIAPESEDGETGPAATAATQAAAAALPAPKAATVRRPATRAQVRALIAELLDDRETAASLMKVYAGERAMQLEMAEWMGGSAPLLRPMFQLDAARMAAANEPILEAASQSSWPAAKAVIAKASVGPAAPPGGGLMFPLAGAVGAVKRQPVDYPRLLSSNLFGGLATGRAIDQHMRARADRRMSAVSLATQLYLADTGRWPPSMDALVPKYLPAAPVDPMAPGTTPLKYLLVPRGLPDGSDRPLVYSVGGNGVDDTPDATVLPMSPWSGWHNGRDEYRDIARWVPPTAAPTSAPSTQAADN